MRKGTLGNNFFIFNMYVCPLVKCNSLERSDKASRIYSGYNISNS